MGDPSRGQRRSVKIFEFTVIALVSRHLNSVVLRFTDIAIYILGIRGIRMFYRSAGQSEARLAECLPGIHTVEEALRHKPKCTVYR